MRGSRGLYWLALCGVLTGGLTGCVSNSVREQASGSYFSGVSAVHSELNLKLKLLMARDSSECKESKCAANRQFETRVGRIGDRLAVAAFATYPELKTRFEKFVFVVADKQSYGVSSSDAGTVVVLRGVDRLGLDDSGLAFVMAREMAHVIVGHHEENAITSIVFSLAAQVLMPMLNVARGAAAVVATNSAASSVVASAAAMAGSQAVQSTQRDEQLRQAEALGLDLIGAAGFGARTTLAALQLRVKNFPLEDQWVLELRGSIARASQLAAVSVPDLKPKPANLDSAFLEVTRAQALIAGGADPSTVTLAPAAGLNSKRELRLSENLANQDSKATPGQIALRSPRMPAWLRNTVSRVTQGIGGEP